MDIAIWRQRNDEFDGYVLRLFGCERQLSVEEWRQLRYMSAIIDEGQVDEVRGEGYSALEYEGNKVKLASDEAKALLASLTRPLVPMKRR